MESSPYFVTRQRLVQAPPGAIFELLADPSKHPLIDGSGTVKRSRAEEPERLSLGAEFGMDMRIGLGYRIQNTVVEFEEARLIAWRHFNGHRWRYELTPAPRGTLVRETWDASRLKRQWPLKLMGFTRSTPVNIERTLDRLADYFDPTTPRPTDPEPPAGPRGSGKAKPLTPEQAARQAAKHEAQRQARARKAAQADESAASFQAAKAARAARAAEARAARVAARAERVARKREAEETRAAGQSAAASESTMVFEGPAKPMKAAKAGKASMAASQTTTATAVKAVKPAKAAKPAKSAKPSKVAKSAKPSKVTKPTKVAKGTKAANEAGGVAASVEPVPPIAATVQPAVRPSGPSPRLPSRAAIAAAKAGRPLPAEPATEPLSGAAAAETTPKPTRGPATGRPEDPVRRMRRAS